MRTNTTYPKTVTNCYDIVDVMYVGGVGDLTDGKYFGDESTGYLKAQENQAEYLLDEIGCKKGSKILDVGCGNGRILAAAEARGAEAIGITISERQIKRNRDQGLTVELMNYRDIPESWNGKFDGIIANGSIEHFVQPHEVKEGKLDSLYEEMFDIFARVLKPGGRVATTVIHQNFNSEIKPEEVLRGSKAHEKGTEIYHCAKLAEDLGGWYPTGDQFERLAKKHFNHIKREDGTQDYHWTSEYWLRMIKRKLLTSPKIWVTLFLKFLKYPRALFSMLNTMIIQQSWMWQFREREDGTTPTILYRDTWLKR